MPTDATYAIADLARITGLNVRTIRYYIAQGLIPASGESGPGAHYGQGHLDRLRLTKRLQAQHLPLSEIRGRLAELTDQHVAELVATEAEERESPGTSALEYVRRLLAPSFPPHRKMQADLLGAAPTSERPADVAPHPEPCAVREPAAPFAMLAAATTPAMPRLKDVPAGPPKPGERPSNQPQSLERSQWERLSLGPNLELHVRRPLSRLEQRRVERLITIARQVLKEDGV
jgi:DNA-binding transcriptional MerR regulator